MFKSNIQFFARYLTVLGAFASAHCFAEVKLPLTFNIVTSDDFTYEKTYVLHTQIYRLPANQQQVLWPDIIEVGVFAQSMREQDNYVQLELSADNYCARFFVDTNANQQLDVSALGIPLEPVGFATNPNLTFGEPSPTQACFNLQSGQELTVKLKEKKAKRRFKP